MQISSETKSAGTRARPLSVDARQAMIVEAVMPLLAKHGRDITSKQIAEAAGIAEGTIFRAFGDKETLIEAAIEKYLDPEPLRRGLRAIDSDLPLEEKTLRAIVLMKDRFGEVFRVMAMIGGGRPPASGQRTAYVEIIAEMLAPDLEQLNCDPTRVAHIIRLISFASSFPQLNHNVEFSASDLTQILLYGIAGHPIATQESQD
ncbi:MAG: TetR/AcrR family transcriptional regulator [Lacisediminihabitans sp.]